MIYGEDKTPFKLLPLEGHQRWQLRHWAMAKAIEVHLNMPNEWDRLTQTAETIFRWIVEDR